MQAIKAPEVCPSCEYTLVWRDDLLYCENESCSAKLNKKIEHFAKTIKIKGLGPKTVEKLDLGNFHEIYLCPLLKILQKYILTQMVIHTHLDQIRDLIPLSV